MVKEVCMEKMLSDATENFTTGFMCSESVLEVLNRHYELGIGADTDSDTDRQCGQYEHQALLWCV